MPEYYNLTMFDNTRISLMLLSSFPELRRVQPILLLLKQECNFLGRITVLSFSPVISLSK